MAALLPRNVTLDLNEQIVANLVGVITTTPFTVTHDSHRSSKISLSVSGILIETRKQYSRIDRLTRMLFPFASGILMPVINIDYQGDGQMTLSARLMISAILMLIMTGCLDVNRASEPKLQLSSIIHAVERRDADYIFTDEIYTLIYGPNTQLAIEVDRLKYTLTLEQRDQFESSIKILVQTKTVTKIRMLDLLKTLNGKTALEVIAVFNARQDSEARRRAHRPSPEVSLTDTSIKFPNQHGI